MTHLTSLVLLWKQNLRPYGDEKHDCAKQINMFRHEVADYFSTKVPTQAPTTIPTITPSVDKKKRWALPDFDIRVEDYDQKLHGIPRNDHSEEDLNLISSLLSEYFVAFLCVGIAQGNCGVELKLKLTPSISGLFGEQNIQMSWNVWLIYSSDNPSILPLVENRIVSVTEECCRDHTKIFDYLNSLYLNSLSTYTTLKPFLIFMELKDYSNCNEDPDAMFMLNYYSGTKASCEWLAKRPNGKKKQLCSNLLDGRAAQVCPETCGFCNNKCSDDLHATFTMENGKKKKCGWLSDSSWYQSKLCEGPTFAKLVCPDTCKGLCRDTQKYNFASCRTNPCTDDPDWIFKIEPTRKTRSCAWLSNVSLQTRARYCNAPTNAALTCPDTCKDLCNRMDG